MQMAAHDVELVTDHGVVTIDGTISADSANDRGSIRLYGAGVILTGALHADEIGQRVVVESSKSA